MRLGNKDNGGTYLTLFNVTLLTNVDWFDILFKNRDKKMHLCTFGYPDADKTHRAASYINKGKVIIGTRYPENTWNIERQYKNVKVKYDSHAKILLIAPDEVYLSSQNIEYDDWYQTTIHIKDKRAYDHYLEQFYDEWSEEKKSQWSCNNCIITPADKIRYF